MKKSILDPDGRASILARIGNMKADAPAQWGKMNAAQCICHIADQIRVALNTLPTVDRSTFMSRTFVKTLVMLGMPAPKGKVPTAPEIDQVSAGTKPTTFEADRKELLLLIERFLATGDGYAYQPHPFFGALSKKQWGKLIWTHLDHHLSQFGA
jgi:Protein of unknown function (DUF1569)